MCSLQSHLPQNTRRFTIRYFLEGELEWLYALETDENVKRLVGSGPVRKVWADWSKDISPNIEDGEVRDDYMLAVVERESNELIGTCGLFREALYSSDVAPKISFDLRVVLYPRKQESEGNRGKEIASRLIEVATQKVGASVFTANVSSENSSAVRLARELGFSKPNDGPLGDSPSTPSKTIVLKLVASC